MTRLFERVVQLLQPPKTRGRIRTRRYCEPLEDRCLLAAEHPLSIQTIFNGDASRGIAFLGEKSGDVTGRPPNRPVDINNDGFDDFLAGSPGNDENGRSSGKTYVYFGRADGYVPQTELYDLDGVSGFAVAGHQRRMITGDTLAGAGDVNGDGIHDLIIGAPLSAVDGVDDVGQAFVIFGRTDDFPATIKTDELDGTNGFALNGTALRDVAGNWVNSAGDVNGDGLDDLFIGTDLDDGPQTDTGSAMIVYGSDEGFPAEFWLEDLNGENGFVLRGVDMTERTGHSVDAGDINGDGIVDLLIGSETDGLRGRAYIVFGTEQGFPAEVDLGALVQGEGFVIEGLADHDDIGNAANIPGDINGDGYDDILLGAGYVDVDGVPDVGEAYLIYGQPADQFPLDFDLLSIDGTNGTTFVGLDEDDRLGETSAAGLGDINADGYDDLIISAAAADLHGLSSGEAYIIFGRPDGFSARYRVDQIDGTNGFRIDGAAEADFVGRGGALGDINGDGFDDIAVAAHGQDAGQDAGQDRINNGVAYAVFGTDFLNTVSLLGDAAPNLLTGDASANSIVGGQNNDTLVGAGGFDVLRGGQGDDVLAVEDMEFHRVHGGRGTDVWRFDGPDTVIDLPAIPNNRIREIEVIDLRGSGDHRLLLNKREVLQLSETSNTLVVHRTGHDIVQFVDAGWRKDRDVVLDGVVYEVFQNGRAEVVLEQAEIVLVEISASSSQGAESDESQITLEVIAENPVSFDEWVEVEVTGQGLKSTDYSLEDDLSAPGIQILIPAGTDTGSITFQVLNDPFVEATETATIAIVGLSTRLDFGAETSLDIVIQNDDLAGIASTISNSEIAEGESRTVEFRLTGQPETSVFLELENSNPAELGLDTSRITFTSDTWNIPRSVQVIAVDDERDDGDQFVELALSVDAARSDAHYVDVTTTVELRTLNDDVAAVEISESDGGSIVSEDGISDTVDIRLTSQPLGNVILSLTNPNDAEFRLSPHELTFSSGNWDQSQSVSLQAIDDLQVEGRQRFDIPVTVFLAANDQPYRNLSSAGFQVVVEDDDAGVRVHVPSVGLLLSEDGQTDELGVSLTGQPAADVVLEIQPPGDFISADRATLTFGPNDWNVPQLVALSAVDNFAINRSDIFNLDVTVDQFRSAVAFRELIPTHVPVRLVDNDLAGLVIHQNGPTIVSEQGNSDSVTVSLSAEPRETVELVALSTDTGEMRVETRRLRFDAMNWNVPQTVSVSGVDDAAVDGTQDVSLLLRVVVNNSDPDFHGLPDHVVSVQTLDNDEARFSTSLQRLRLAEGGPISSVNVVLDARPLTPVVLQVAGTAVDLDFMMSQLTFTPDNWNVAQELAVRAVDNFVDDGNRDVEFQLEINRDDSDPAFGDIESKTIGVTLIDNDTRGVEVSPASGQTDETGGRASFTIALLSEPTDVVTIALASTNSDEGVVQDAAVFTPENWNSRQQIFVTGVDDDVDDADVSFMIVTSTAQGGDYSGIDVPDVHFRNRDNDERGLVVSRPSGNVTEDGGIATIGVQLASEPTSNVTVNLRNSNTSEANLLQSQLVFSPDNWNERQVVEVQGIDDRIDDGNQPIVISLSSVGGDYNGLAPSVVSLSNVDNDRTGLVVSGQNVIVSEGDSTTFSVALNSMPMEEIVVHVATADAHELTVNRERIVFTPDNWDVPISVRIHGTDDEFLDGAQQRTVVVSAEVPWTAVPVEQVVQVTIEDNETPGIEVNSNRFLVSDDGSGSIGISLASAPLTPVSLRVRTNDRQIQLSANELEFTWVNWDEPQTLEVASFSPLVSTADTPTVEIEVIDGSSDPKFRDEVLSIPIVKAIDNLPVLDVDGDGRVTPLVDGVLVMRYLAGFTGSALVSDVISPGSRRRNGVAVASWLNARRAVLEIDGDATTAPLTDGILTTRYLAGFRGSVLINGAINEEQSSRTADEITAHLLELTQPTAETGSLTPQASAAASNSSELFTGFQNDRKVADDLFAAFAFWDSRSDEFSGQIR